MCSSDLFSRRDQFAVNKPVPSAFYSFNNDVALKSMSKRGGGTVIEEYEHRPLGQAAGQEARPGSAQQIRSRRRLAHATNGTTP